MKYREVERVVKGFANHRRIQIMEFLEKHPEYSVGEIAEALRIHFKTAAQHIQRLTSAGVVVKRSDGTSIRHALTKRGTSILKFLRIME